MRKPKMPVRPVAPKPARGVFVPLREWLNVIGNAAPKPNSAADVTQPVRQRPRMPSHYGTGGS